MLPITLVFPTSAAISGYIVSKTHKHRYINIVAFLLILGGLGGFITLRETSRPATQVGFQLLIAAGGGVVFTSKVFMVQSSVAKDDVLMATALVATATSLGECLGVSVASNVFQNRWSTILEQKMQQLLPQTLSVVISSGQAEGSAEVLAKLDPQLAMIYRKVASLAFEWVWIVLAALAGIGLIFVVISKDLNEKDVVE